MIPVLLHNRTLMPHNVEIAHTYVLCNLEIGTQFPDSENAQHNLEIAQHNLEIAQIPDIDCHYGNLL